MEFDIVATFKQAAGIAVVWFLFMAGVLLWLRKRKKK